MRFFAVFGKDCVSSTIHTDKVFEGADFTGMGTFFPTKTDYYVSPMIHYKTHAFCCVVRLPSFDFSTNIAQGRHQRVTTFRLPLYGVCTQVACWGTGRQERMVFLMNNSPFAGSELSTVLLSCGLRTVDSHPVGYP